MKADIDVFARSQKPGMMPLSSEVLESIAQDQRLLDDQDDEHELPEGAEQSRKSRQLLRRKCAPFSHLIGIAACIAIAQLLIAVIANVGIRKLSTVTYGVLDCGESPAEARAKGCFFDIMTYAWTPLACYEEDLAEEALRTGPWPWYLDKNATQEIPQDPAILGGIQEVWTTYDYHASHCLYAAKLVHRAALRGGFLLQEVEEWNHTTHCHALLTNRTLDPTGVNTRIIMDWNKCIKLPIRYKFPFIEGGCGSG